MTGPAEHRIRWFVRVGDDWIPRTSTMRGLWFYDAKCSCGWESRTGGATERSVRRSIVDHRADVAWAAKDGGFTVARGVHVSIVSGRFAGRTAMVEAKSARYPGMWAVRLDRDITSHLWLVAESELAELVG